MARIIADVDRLIVPALTHWSHPSFFAYFATSTSAPGIFGELLSAAFDNKAMLWRTSPASTELEEVTLDWLRQMMGLDAGYTGIIYDEGGVAGGRGIMSKRGEKTVWDKDNKRTDAKLEMAEADIKKAIKPVGEWNDCVVVADGTHIVYSINGVVTTDLTDESPKGKKDGLIALQMHAGPPMTIQFKDIKIKMLEAKK